MADVDPPYRILDAAALPAFVARLAEVRAILGGDPPEWRVTEVGDGNLNLVFCVEGMAGRVCVKQALPFVRVAGPTWPLSPQRAFFESEYFRILAPHVGELIPRVYHYDPELHCIVMEWLSPHIILRHGLIAGRRYPAAARDIGEYIARACFFTSDLARPFEAKWNEAAVFAGNQSLMRITVDLVFAEPYYAADRNRHNSPHLDPVVEDLRRDGPLKVAAASFGYKFLTSAQALIHGDLHSGSVMVSATDTRVIDPEFAFHGPIGFDLGAFFANLLLNWYSQSGHSKPGDDRTAYREWILEQMRVFWTAFRDRFMVLWAEHGAGGDAYAKAVFHGPDDEVPLELVRAAFLDTLFADMLGFGACKMIRRILGFAHVLDLDAIADGAIRAKCETGALEMAGVLLKAPQQFRSIDQVIDAVPRMAIAG